MIGFISGMHFTMALNQIVKYWGKTSQNVVPTGLMRPTYMNSTKAIEKISAKTILTGGATEKLPFSHFTAHG